MISIREGISVRDFRQGGVAGTCVKKEKVTHLEGWREGEGEGEGGGERGRQRDRHPQ